MKNTVCKIMMIMTAARIVSGCAGKVEYEPEQGASGYLPVLFERYAGFGNAEAAAAEEFDEVFLFNFRDGALVQAPVPVFPSEEGGYSVDVSGMDGKVYVLASGTGEIDLGAVDEGMSESDFKDMKARYSGDGNTIAVFCTEQDLGAGNSTASLVMRRVAARVDVSVLEEDICVNSISIENVSLEGGIFMDMSSAMKGTLSVSYPSGTWSGGEGVFYLFGQPSDGIMVRAVVMKNGEEKELSMPFPYEIRRNNIYTLKFIGDSSAETEMVIEEWESGEDIAVCPDLSGSIRIDKDASDIPDDVFVEDAGDADIVILPYDGCELTLKFNIETDIDLIPASDSPRISVSHADNGGRCRNVFNVRSLNSSPSGKAEDFTYRIKVNYLGEVFEDKVIFRISENRNVFEGKFVFDDNSVCRFDSYMENEIGTVTVPDGKILEVVPEDLSKEWIKAFDGEVPGQYRIVAGWRPNDPEADGREQSATIRIMSQDGSKVEEYFISRRNWGLPVVNINGTWWCKYNLSGNVKDFSDQILVSNDPAASVSLSDYVASCSDDELLAVLGDQYQGGNRNALPLSLNGNGVYYYAGMTSTGSAWNSLSRDYMAPDGYILPDYDDFLFLSTGNNFTFGYEESEYLNQAGQTIKVKPVRRTPVFLGKEYGEMYLDSFTYQGNELVLCGLGHQWDTYHGSISSMYILFATYENNTWAIEGTPMSAGTGITMKYGNHNSKKTRTIRCIKAPVEFIY